MYLALQSYQGDWVSAEDWRNCMDALDHPKRWFSLGQEKEDNGQLIQANLRFAAAMWLDPKIQADRERVVTQRPSNLPSRLRRQPRTNFRELSARERHWEAWDMKNYGLLDQPSLMTHASDENFSIRTRIYRSIGQQPHPATIQLLHEATLDPHWFARAQAVRSLGWTCDPTFIDKLHELRTEDASPEVRRSACKAIQRIVGFWLHFGHWQKIVKKPGAAIEVARELAQQGLATFANEILQRFSWEDPASDALSHELEPFALDRDDPSFEYHHHFPAAKEFEDALSPPVRESEVLRQLEHSEQAERMMALYRVSRHRMTSLVPTVLGLVRDPGPLGWNARRVMRHLNLGDGQARRFYSSRFNGER